MVVLVPVLVSATAILRFLSVAIAIGLSKLALLLVQVGMRMASRMAVMTKVPGLLFPWILHHLPVIGIRMNHL